MSIAEWSVKYQLVDREKVDQAKNLLMQKWKLEKWPRVNLEVRILARTDS